MNPPPPKDGGGVKNLFLLNSPPPLEGEIQRGRKEEKNSNILSNDN